MTRDPADKVTISYRFPESLRARLAQAAERDGLNITQEITKCIEWYLDEDERFAISSPLIRMQGQALKQSKNLRGKDWFEDKETAGYLRNLLLGIVDLMIPGATHENPLLGGKQRDELADQLDAVDVALEVIDVRHPEAAIVLDRTNQLNRIARRIYEMEEQARGRSRGK